MNRRTLMMINKLVRFFGYTEDDLDNFAWSTDDDLPEKYVMTFYDHKRVKKQYIHDNKTGKLTLYVWRDNQWQVEKSI